MTNVIMIQMDDTSTEIFPHMSMYGELINSGYSFSNNFLDTPVCGPSRASCITGRKPEHTGVLRNQWPLGGYTAFLLDPTNASESLFVHLHNAPDPVRVYFGGKLINAYDINGETNGGGEPSYGAGEVLAGIDVAHVVAEGYKQWGYDYTQKALGGTITLEESTSTDRDQYLCYRQAGWAEDFITQCVADEINFYMHLTPFSTHSGLTGDPEGAEGPKYPPHPDDRPLYPPPASRPVEWGDPPYPETGDLGEAPITWPDPVGEPWFNVIGFRKPIWYPIKPLGAAKLIEYMNNHLDRIRMAQCVNDLLKRLRDHLQALGVWDDTWIILTSDNGFHLAQHALTIGKGTAYDYDVKVPLVIKAPASVEGGVVLDQLAMNIDLAPTILDIFGAPIPTSSMDGYSLLPYINGDLGAPERLSVPLQYYGDADETWVSEKKSGNPPPWRALHTRDWLFVDYSDDRNSGVPPTNARGEFYLKADDPFYLNNRYRELTDPQKEFLYDLLVAHYEAYGDDARAAYQLDAEVPGLEDIERRGGFYSGGEWKPAAIYRYLDGAWIETPYYRYDETIAEWV